MRLELTGRHVSISDGLRTLVEEKLAKLERKLNQAALSAQVVVARDKYRLTTEITLHARGEKWLHGVGAARDWETSILGAIRKLEQQAEKLKGKWKDRKRRGAGAGKATRGAAALAAATPPAPPEAPAIRVVRARRYAVKPMSVEEAALEVGDHPDAFVVFRNDVTEAITVLFRRKDGHLGLIEPEA